MHTTMQWFIPAGTFGHFMKCQKVRTGLHAIYDGHDTRNVTTFDMHKTRAGSRLYVPLGLRQHTMAFVAGGVVRYFCCTLRLGATVELPMCFILRHVPLPTARINDLLYIYSAHAIVSH